MNKTGQYIQQRKDVLSIYFTAEYPKEGDTQSVLLALQDAGTDVIEVGIPYSDPLADGPVIQQSGQQALHNGFTIAQLFKDLEAVRDQVTMPLIPMGYFNTVLSFGVHDFMDKCQQLAIDTLILPDLPIDVYELEYQEVFQEYGVSPVFLITPQTSVERIRKIDNLSEAFIYVVADNSITGNKGSFSPAQLEYFKRIQNLELTTPLMIGFGISDNQTFIQACKHANGAIIGSAYIRALTEDHDINRATQQFINAVKAEQL